MQRHGQRIGLGRCKRLACSLSHAGLDSPFQQTQQYRVLTVMLYCSRHRVAVCRSNCRPCAPVSKPCASRARGMCNERLPAPIARPVSSSSAIASRTATAEEATKQDFTWKGSDSFSKLDDRKDQTPLPLPKITESKRVVLVRHGQSTWNAEGRIQGSTDFAELTQKGRSQADTTRGTVSIRAAYYIQVLCLLSLT